jgi:glycolate dehydrogenase FAD-binding subunit
MAETIRQAAAGSTPVYPLGGRTSLDVGLAARKPGWGLSLEKLNRVVDYPARDMTVTVEAGVTMSQLAECLAAEQQRLPVDAARAREATLGGVIATNFSGPRRYGFGTIRDYVIGIQAVNGRGTIFNGGGRVVKNVAGYDFCKLLTGSLGTLAVITQVTLKVKPLAAASALVWCDLPKVARAEPLLAAMVNSQTTPAAIELLAGPAWQSGALPEPLPPGSARLLVGLEGTQAEVGWMIDRLTTEWREQGVVRVESIASEQVAGVWGALTEFPAVEGSPLVVKVSVRASAVCDMMERLVRLDPQCSLQAHAGNGIVVARFAEFSPADASRVLVSELQPAAAAAGGHAIVWSSACPQELTRQAVWGPAGADGAVMRAVKAQFDPQGILNPHRFVYGE